MPNRKEWVRKTVSFEEVHPTPYWLTFTPGAAKRLREHLKVDDLDGFIGNYVAATLTNCCHGVVPANLQGDTWRDDFGVVWKGAGVDRGAPAESPLANAASLRGYAFPDPDDPRRFDDLETFVRQNEDVYVYVSIDFGLLFERAWYLRGMEQLLMDFHMNPAFVEELLDRLVDYYLRSIEIISEFRGIDSVYLVDDYGIQGGLAFSPDMWRRFFKPRLATIVQAVKAHGFVPHLHSCGNVSDLVGDFIEIGIRILDPLQPEAMDVRHIKERFGDRLALMGGFSAQRVIPRGTAAEVRRHVRDRLAFLGKGGGYIASNAIPLQTDVPLENLLALIDALKSQ